MMSRANTATLCHSVLKRQPQWLSVRGIVSSYAEPPLDSDVPEKPFSLVLLEDTSLYKDSWEGTFHTTIPQEYGMTFISLSSEISLSTSEKVDSLKIDIGQISDAILVARGPQASWVAQLYLESLFLRGLIMVDPIMFDQPKNIVQEIVNDLGKASDIDFDRFVLEAQDRPLKLEPNSVSMLVMNSKKSILEASIKVAERHSHPSGPYGEIEVVEIDDSSSQEDRLRIITSLDNWVDTIY